MVFALRLTFAVASVSAASLGEPARTLAASDGDPHLSSLLDATNATNATHITVPPNKRLAALLKAQNVTTVDLSLMIAESYSLNQPNGSAPIAPVSLSPVGAWIGSIPNNQSDILPAALFTHSESSQKILAFQGVNAAPPNATAHFKGASDTQTACLANLIFKGTPGSIEFDKLCSTFNNGAGHVKLAQLAEEALSMLRTNPGVTLLTGHSMGCETALSLGRITSLPVVCFSMPGSFGAEWVDAWPGLARAIAADPQPENAFALQVKTDPYSNCLTPRLGDDPTRQFAAATCAFAGPPPGCTQHLSYYAFTPCVEDSHFAPNIIGHVPLTFNASECTDLCEASIADCPLLPPPPPSHLPGCQ